MLHILVNISYRLIAAALCAHSW